MGQQQLMLVILVVIIVGLTTIIAVNILGQGADNANRDAVRQDLISAASRVQELWERPTLLDGADKNFTGDGITNGWILSRLNIPSSSYDVSSEENELINENGTYEIEIIDVAELEITGTPSNGGEDIVVNVSRNETTGNWTFSINGEEVEEE